MKKRQKLLTDEQWELIGPLFPEPKRRKDGRGRPWAANRTCLEGILWVLQTGAAWRFLPDEYPSPSTCWRRLKQWEEEGIWLNAWRTLLGALDAEGLLKWDEAFLDGSFAPAKKGAMQSAKPSVVKAQSGWYWETVKVFRWEFGWKVPLRQKLRLRTPRSTRSASPGRKGRPRQKPKRVIADRGYDSDPLRETMETARHRADRALPEEQQGEEIRRWPETATLQTALDYRTHQRLAGTVPPIARPP